MDVNIVHLSYLFKELLNQGLTDDDFRSIANEKNMDSDSKKKIEDMALDLKNQFLSLSSPGSPVPGSPTRKDLEVVRGLCDGVFDMVHSGHFNAIRQAANLVDFLVVGVNSDAETAYAKGPTVFNQNERAAMVRECKWVKEVVIGTPYLLTPQSLDEYNCKYYLHGDDIVILPGGEDLSVRFKAVGRYKEFARTRGVSTTNIVGKLLLNIKENKASQEENPT